MIGISGKRESGNSVLSKRLDDDDDDDDDGNILSRFAITTKFLITL